MAGSEFWFPAANTTLVAWMDFCLETGLNYRETIIEEIHATRKECGYERVEMSLQQVMNKLFFLARKTPLEDEEDQLASCNCILEVGSTCIHDMSQHDQRAITKAIARYTVNRTHLLRQKNQHNDHGKSLKEVDDEFIPGSNSESDGSHSSVRQRKHDKGSESRNFNFTGNQANSTTIGTNRKRAICLELETPKSTKSVNKHSSSIDKETRPPPHLEHRGSESQPLRTPSPASIILPSKFSSTEKLQDQLKEKEIEIKVIRRRWHEQVGALAERNRKQKLVEQELRAEIKHLSLARQQREKAGRDPLESVLFQNNQGLWKLTQRVTTMNQLNYFTQNVPDQSLRLTSKKIDSSLERIACELETIVHGLGDQTIPKVSNLAGEDDLLSLLQSLADGPVVGREASWLRKSVSTYKPEVVIGAIIVAALRNWIFATGFPDFHPTNKRLLQAYREIVITYDGWRNLHNLDTAAYRSMINWPHFKDFAVPNRADQLAFRLLKALSPIFKKPNNHVPHPEYPSWGDSRRAARDRHFHLKELFETALHLKAISVITDKAYEFVLYPLGTEHATDESGELEPGKNLGNGHAGMDTGSLRYASIHTYEPEVSLPRDVTEDALVQLQNFVTKDLDERKAKSLQVAYLLLAKSDSSPAVSNNHNNAKPTPLIAVEIAQNLIIQLPMVPRDESKTDNLLTAPEDSSKTRRLQRTVSFNSYVEIDESESEDEEVIEVESVTEEGEIVKGKEVIEGKQNMEEEQVPEEESVIQEGEVVEEGQNTEEQRVVVVEAGINAERVGSPDVSGNLACQICGREFTKPEGIKRHTRTQTCSWCIECGEILQDKLLLKRHQKAIHQMKDVQTPLISQEILNSSRKTSNCHSCKRRFIDEKTLDLHENDMHRKLNEKQIPTIDNGMEKHQNESNVLSAPPVLLDVEQMPPNPLIQFSCQCGEIFISKKRYDTHREEFCKQCSVCESWFPNLRLLGKHQAKEHLGREQSLTSIPVDKNIENQLIDQDEPILRSHKRRRSSATTDKPSLSDDRGDTAERQSPQKIAKRTRRLSKYQEDQGIQQGSKFDADFSVAQ